MRFPLFRRLRLAQIRLCAASLISLGRRQSGARFIVRLRSSPMMNSLMRSCLGFRGVFPSFATAQSCASRYIPAGHEHPDETLFHASISGTVRESDYPVLFHLAPFAPSIHRVFDLGGNIGNLFYSYQPHLNFPPDLTWTVYDIPAVRSIGERRAAQRGETRLGFTGNLASAKGADLLIVSGSLHYFEESVDALLRKMESSPTHLVVNRTPCSTGEDLITVQDNRTFLVPCKLHSRSKLIERMQSAGYRLIAEWPAHELRLPVPMYPDVSARTYSGFYFRKN